MKIWKFIQKAVVAAGFVTTIALIDGSSATGKETWAAFVMLAMIVIYIINYCVGREKEEEKHQ